MTDEQKEQREEAFKRSCGYCEVCGKSLYEGQMQAAHRITNDTVHRNRYGSFIIDHPLNVAYTCSLGCNASVDLGNNEGAILKLIAKIVSTEIRKFTEDKR